ncbi:hypothetical protein Vafri_18309 [Volvox africanus]|uniref:Pherophorin domain-containing protein n=1 Tax=Volvox africanus TaxID=51714 RepID=A0A8J4BM47_9CHLO|nr:hypothetical protein Vafri_18309 [Volvox africanus]
MKHAAVTALLIAAAFVAAPLPSAAQNGTFPFFKCGGTPTPYSFPGSSASYRNGTFCGTLAVTPPKNASDPCAKADLRKIEVNINPACDVKNTIVKATINGVPTAVSPSFFVPAGAPEGSVALRLTQLGLGLGNDGDNICITLSAKTPGANACTNLESLCQAPPGAAPGTCVAALVDTTLRCCAINEVSPVRPPPRLTCGYVHPRPTATAIFPLTIESRRCNALGTRMINDTLNQAALVGAVMDDRVKPFYNCSDTVIRACWAFNSPADGAKLQAWAKEVVVKWHDYASGLDQSNLCRPWLSGYQMDVVIGGVGTFPDVPLGDVNANYTQDAPADKANIVCGPDKSKVDYPKCTCNTTVFATRFGVDPWIYMYPGRKRTTTLYCFTVLVVNASDPTSPCGRTDKLFKAEIWGDDKQRQKLKGIAVQPAGAKTFTYRSPSWGAPGDQTIKVSQLNWTPQQAHGAQVCLELDSTTDIDSFCIYGLAKTCWINFFDESLACCPLYPSNVDPAGK